MKAIPDEKVDLIVTDPPFAINFKAKKANYNRTASRVLSGYNEIKVEDYYDFTNAWMHEAYRILKKIWEYVCIFRLEQPQRYLNCIRR